MSSSSFIFNLIMPANVLILLFMITNMYSSFQNVQISIFFDKTLMDLFRVKLRAISSPILIQFFHYRHATDKRVKFKCISNFIFIAVLFVLSVIASIKIDEYTRFSSKKSSFLDNIVKNLTNSMFKAGIYDPCFTDHVGLYLFLKSEPLPKQNNIKKF